MSWFMWHYTGNGTVTMGTVDSDSIAGDESGRYGCVGRWWAGGENNSSFGTNASLNSVCMVILNLWSSKIFSPPIT
jgi:hypothetical protein